jgi:hypothetical protein
MGFSEEGMKNMLHVHLVVLLPEEGSLPSPPMLKGVVPPPNTQEKVDDHPKKVLNLPVSATESLAT